MRVPRAALAVPESAGERVPEPRADGAVDEKVDRAVEEEHEVVDGRERPLPLGMALDLAVLLDALLRLLRHRDLVG